MRSAARERRAKVSRRRETAIRDESRFAHDGTGWQVRRRHGLVLSQNRGPHLLQKLDRGRR